jgi:hypothetical protein
MQRKPFANVTSLIHLIAETRALNRKPAGLFQAALR